MEPTTHTKQSLKQFLKKLWYIRFAFEMNIYRWQGPPLRAFENLFVQGDHNHIHILNLNYYKIKKNKNKETTPA